MSWSTDQTLLAGGSHWVSFCHTVGVRTPQKHLGVGKAIGNGKKIKRQYHLRSCLKAGRVSKTQSFG